MVDDDDAKNEDIMQISIDEKDGEIECSDSNHEQANNNNLINLLGNVFKKAYQGVKLFRNGIK